MTHRTSFGSWNVLGAYISHSTFARGTLDLTDSQIVDTSNIKSRARVSCDSGSRRGWKPN